MRLRGILTALAAMLLLAGMFVAVHRGASGRGIAERISEVNHGQEAASLRRSELAQRVEYLRSRPRIIEAAEGLGLHQPSEEELVILDLSGMSSSAAGGSS